MLLKLLTLYWMVAGILNHIFVLADQDQLTLGTCEERVQPRLRSTQSGPIAIWLGTTRCPEGPRGNCLKKFCLLKNFCEKAVPKIYIFTGKPSKARCSYMILKKEYIFVLVKDFTSRSPVS